ncbi:hypothetical protein QYM36_009137 [Artemia franciscana]|uniref:Uncharacterized protein n=1 Tax=Artemia franciscana TaxID=6661 RepID=A0AA88HVC4_ARTSF|nr:hypothetical protein QYM36_009137 [Artemia franciscana]
MCCDATASNTGRFNGAYAILEQTLGSELLLFLCHHHVYELVLKAVFETKIKQIASSSDIPMFKKLRENQKNIDSSNIEPSLNFVTGLVAETDIQALLIFFVLSLFDDELDSQTKKKMIANFNRDRISDFSNRNDPSEEELTQKLFDKTEDDFESEKSKQFLSQL